MKRGICFPSEGDKIVEGITENRQSLKGRRAHKGMSDEMKKELGMIERYTQTHQNVG